MKKYILFYFYILILLLGLNLCGFLVYYCFGFGFAPWDIGRFFFPLFYVLLIGLLQVHKWYYFFSFIKSIGVLCLLLQKNLQTSDLVMDIYQGIYGCYDWLLLVFEKLLTCQLYSEIIIDCLIIMVLDILIFKLVEKRTIRRFSAARLL